MQEYLQTVDNVVVDIGASNVEDLLALMRKYRGSHENFDYFVIPTVPALKQQPVTPVLTGVSHCRCHSLCRLRPSASSSSPTASCD